MSLPCKLQTCLPPGWLRYPGVGDLWCYRVDRLPLGWLLNYADDGSVFFHNTLHNYCTRDDPRETVRLPKEQEHVPEKPAPLRKISTGGLVEWRPVRSSTIPQLHEDFEEYRYSPLKAPTSIRLLKWMGRDDQSTPRFSIEEHEIEKAPPYIALSYTWGNPFPDNNALYGTENQWPVLCDGKVMLVTRNLHDFLQHKDPKYDDSSDAVGGGSALHYAAHRGRLETVANLLAIGANINSRDAMDRTPLFLAVHAEHEEVVRLLLAHGADTSLRVNSKMYIPEYTPLHIAVALKNISIVEALLDAGASLEARQKNNMTALHDAIWRKNAKMARVLLERGANIETRAIDPVTGETLLLDSALRDDIDCVKLLVSFGADVNATTGDGSTALHHAAKANAAEVVRYLLEAGTNPHLKKHETSWSPLHTAAVHGSPEIILALLEVDIDIDIAETGDGRTPLSLACEFDRVDNLTCLLERGASVKKRRLDGSIPLHLAAMRRSVSAVEMLLARGADVDASTELGETPLQKAVAAPGVSRKEDLDDADIMERIANDCPVIVRILLDHGANVNSKTNLGYSVLHRFAEWHDSGSPAVFELLVAAGANLECPSNINDTPMHSAATWDNATMVRLLVGQEANMNSWNNQLQPLSLALANNSAEAAAVLIELGADINTPNEYGETPLHHAAYRKGGARALEMMLERNVDMNVQTKSGHTALDLARWGRSAEAEEILRAKGAQSGPSGGTTRPNIYSHGEEEQHPTVDEPDNTVPQTTEQDKDSNEPDLTEVSDDISSEHINTQLKEKSLQYFWIDTLCICQTNDAEKCTQVNLMSRIYRHAALVHVWLGLEDSRTRMAAQTVRKLVELHVTKYKGLESNYDPDLAIWWHLQREHYIPPIVPVLLDEETVDIRTDNHKYLVTLEEWECFKSLLHRQWFQRIWVVQEICRAKHVQISCGAQDIVWEDLYRVLMVLTPIRDAFARGPQIWKRISEGTTAFVCAELRSRLQPGADYALNSMQTIITWSNTSRLPLAALLLLTWNFKASDPRDKIYALLGLAKDWDESHAIQPDYERNATDLFVEATQMLIKGFDPIDDAAEEVVEISRKDIPELKPLEILTFVQHDDPLSISSPSWIPSFANPASAPRFWYTGFTPYEDTERWSFPRPGIFRVLGVLCERIEQIEETPAAYAPVDMNRFIYWLSLVPKEADKEFLNAFYYSLIVFSKNERYEYTWDGVHSAFTRWMHFCAQRRILYESETNDLAPEQYDLLDWRSNWDRLAAVSTPASQRPIMELQTISEIQDELNDPLVRLLVLSTTEQEMERDCLPFVTSLQHWMTGRALFRTKRDNMGLGPRSARAGDYVIALAGSETLFTVKHVEEPDEWMLLGEVYMPTFFRGTVKPGWFDFR